MDTTWLSAAQRLRAAREPAELVTLAAVRGHAPRAAGAKMLVSATATSGSIGGGNVEAVAIERARVRLDARADEPELMIVALSDKAPYQHGVQCCGGDVQVLFEPLPVPPAVAIFGIGHVGFELARILARHDLDLHLIDTRPEQLDPVRLAPLADAVARVQVHLVPVLPEIVLGELPPGSHILIMTHDHAEDLALCDAVLREGHWASIGLIGSAGKWVRFQRRLADNGHADAAIARVHTPIGLPEITAKEPAAIAVGVAADLLLRFAGARADVAP